jgi:hypothetical protein
MRFIACRIDASLQERFFLHVALGIAAASFASESGFRYGEWEWDSGTDFFERGENKKRAKI